MPIVNTLKITLEVSLLLVLGWLVIAAPGFLSDRNSTVPVSGGHQ